MTPSKILYVEDEPALAHIVTDALCASGYEVHHRTDGQAALADFPAIAPDICVLDVMLPHIDGFTLAKGIRKAAPGVPIIFLSAKSQAEDVVTGFKSGGDDYLKKPFSVEELLIRISYLLGRSSGTPRQDSDSKVLTFGQCQLDPVQQTLLTPRGKHAISFKETALLELLLAHRNQVLERQVALRQIWGDDSYYNTRSMDVFLTQLRKLLKEDPQVQLINIRGIGYKLVC